MTIMCIVDLATRQIILSVAEKIKEKVQFAASNTEAIELLAAQDTSWTALVTSLDGSPLDHFAHQSLGWCEACNLLKDVKAAHPACKRVVFSLSDCSDNELDDLCRRADAHAIVCSAQALRHALEALVSSEPQSSKLPRPPKSDREGQLIVPTCASINQFGYLSPTATSLLMCESNAPPPAVRGCVRVACIADTHNEHESLVLPPGDILGEHHIASHSIT